MCWAFYNAHWRVKGAANIETPSSSSSPRPTTTTTTGNLNDDCSNNKIENNFLDNTTKASKGPIGNRKCKPKPKPNRTKPNDSPNKIDGKVRRREKKQGVIED